MTREELQDRLIDFTAIINNLCRNFDGSIIARHIADQMIRSSTSAALNYAEARSAESRKDFIHKTKIVLKELRETEVSLRIIQTNRVSKGEENLSKCLKENLELISIFWKTIKTAQKNMSRPSHT